jgi:hypothetical protein
LSDRAARRHAGFVTFRRIAARALPVALIAAVCLATAPSSAAAGSKVTRRGDCSGVSEWKLTVRSVETDTLKVRLVILGGPAGDEWNVFMDHNGEGFYAGSRESGEGGRVVVRRFVHDLDGVDRIRAGALDTVTGETCRSRAALSP